MATPKLDAGRDLATVTEMRKQNPWLAAEDILGSRANVTISAVRMHDWLGHAEVGLHFEGKSKPLLLNATNRYALSVTLGFGRDVSNWIGRRIVLSAEKLAREFAGRTMGVRVQTDAEAKKMARETNGKG